MNVLYLYNATQTYTNTVYEHLAAFGKHSAFRSRFLHVDPFGTFTADLRGFDAVCIHYSIRLPFDQIPTSLEAALSAFDGLKFLFIQDEYDHTWRAWHWIRRLDIRLVFTVVPTTGIARIYPPHEFPDTRFVNVLTGYVPEADAPPSTTLAPSQRSLMIGYRGRPLPVRYGQLGLDKVRIGEQVKAHCDALGMASDIAWGEESRIYGPRWNTFLTSCRATLGTESGSNVFDWDGTLVQKIEQFRLAHPEADDSHVYEHLVMAQELPGVMNQVSPRIFEAIAARTALVLFEGEYSGVVRPHEHFIPLKRDGSNLEEVTAKLQDGQHLDELTARAYADVIASGAYSYRSFVVCVENALMECLSAAPRESAAARAHAPVSEGITPQPIRAQPPAAPAIAPPQPQLRWPWLLPILQRIFRMG